MGKSKVAVVLLIAITVFGFQNCSNANFSTVSGSSGVKAASDGGGPTGNITATGGSGATPGASGGILAFPGQNGVDGIQGGHFDLDTSTLIYPFKAGTTNYHVHEFDKKYQTTTIDFFNLIDSKFDEIQDTIPSGKRFILNVVNSSLSPGGVLEINGGSIGVTGFHLGQVYSIGSASTSGDQLLQSLRLGFSPDILANHGLVPTDTKCVRANDPGKNDEYRDGALTVQALDVSGYNLDPVTGAATSGLLWEATVFWHWDGGCY